MTTVYVLGIRVLFIVLRS